MHIPPLSRPLFARASYANYMHPPAPAAATVLPVGESGAGQRLDNFLARVLKGVPRSHIYRIVRSGEVRVNGARAQASQKLNGSDHVRVPPIRTTPPGAKAPARQYPILHEDAWLLAINKPAGVAVHGGSGLSFGVIESMRAGQDGRFLELVHRLDRDTSGVLLLAKKRSALITLHASLREREADKRYFALVAGLWKGDAVTVNKPLHKFLTASGERRVRVAAAGEGQPARSQFRALERYPWPDSALGVATGIPGMTLIEARIHTGRTHQIRVHMSTIGHPVVNDPRYGHRRDRRLPEERFWLHSRSLSFQHPRTGGDVVAGAALPDDLVQLVGEWRESSQ